MIWVLPGSCSISLLMLDLDNQATTVPQGREISVGLQRRLIVVRANPLFIQSPASLGRWSADIPRRLI
jgi:hypothetical protein